MFIARLGGSVAPFHDGFAYDGVEGTAPTTVLPQKSFVQPMIGTQASGTFANLEIYLCGVYQGWLSFAGAARLADYARGTYALANFCAAGPPFGPIGERYSPARTTTRRTATRAGFGAR